MEIDDRRPRFWALADDARVAAFADGIDIRRTRLLAPLNADVGVVAAVKITMLSRSAVEFPFSVDAAYRHAGFGTALMNRTRRGRETAGNRGPTLILSPKHRLRRMARGTGMEIATAGGETEAVIVLSAGAPLSYAAGALALVDLAARAALLARADNHGPTSLNLPVILSE